MDLGSTELIGERVRLAPMERAHIPGLFAAAQEAEIFRYLTEKIESEADVERVVEEALHMRDAEIEEPFVIFDRETERIVGSTRLLDFMPRHRNVEIGWTWLNPGVWRTRVNTECKYLLLRHCFETLDMVRVQLKTDGRNLQSQRAIERLGATREGILRRHRILPDGYIRDSVLYSITDLEWPGVKERLEAFLHNNGKVLENDG